MLCVILRECFYNYCGMTNGQMKKHVVRNIFGHFSKLDDLQKKKRKIISFFMKNIFFFFIDFCYGYFSDFVSGYTD